MKHVIQLPLRPRNPLVALARARRAGRHAGSETSRRQDARRELRRTLERDTHSP